MSSEHSAASMPGEHVEHVDDHVHDIDKQVRIYIIVFVALMALTLVTVAVSYLHLSTPMAVAVALFVATIKGSLVACYFMHLISERRLIYAVLLITTFKFIVLLALPVFTHSNGFWIPE
jgi:cytochrome c oxidase subunit IV